MSQVIYIYIYILEICGDGTNQGFVECDDGNLENGDGCSSLCTVEIGWSCSGGSEITPDICVDSSTPTATVKDILSNNSFYLLFSEPCKISNRIYIYIYINM